MKIFLFASGCVTYMNKVIIITLVIDLYNIILPWTEVQLSSITHDLHPIFQLRWVYKFDIKVFYAFLFLLQASSQWTRSFPYCIAEPSIKERLFQYMSLIFSFQKFWQLLGQYIKWELHSCQLYQYIQYIQASFNDASGYPVIGLFYALLQHLISAYHDH